MTAKSPRERFDNVLMNLWITDPYTVKYTEVVPKSKTELLDLALEIVGDDEPRPVGAFISAQTLFEDKEKEIRNQQREALRAAFRKAFQ